MRIMNNISSLNAWRNLNQTENNMSKNLERLSSGYRINSASDDVAGLAISENMRAQIRGLNQAVKNAQDGNSLLQTAEGSMNEVHSMLQRMRELAVQAANGTLQPADRSQIQTEMDNLSKETTRITNATQFNSKDLIDGSLQNNNVTSVTLQIGPNGGQTLNFSVGAMDSKSLGISRDVMTATIYNNTATQSVLGGAVVQSIGATGAVGAGMQAAGYRVHFDSTTSTVQLQDAAGTAVGAAVAATTGATVTIGDATSAQTLTLTLKVGLPLVTTDDKVVFGSRTAAVSTVAASQAIIDTTGAGSTGITSVGWGMANNTDYQVRAISATQVQLFDSTGVTAIGAAFTYGGAGTISTVGDASTGRTLSFVQKASPAVTAAAAAGDIVHVTNNGQAAENAKFSGGQKFANSQVFAGLNVSSVVGAQSALASIDSAIQTVSSQRSQLGAIQNRLDHTISNLQVVSENLTASESRIRDVDMAQEMSSFSKHQILSQSGTAMLAQANQKNQGVLQLLR